MTDPCDDTLSNEDLHSQIKLLKDHFTSPITSNHVAREAAVRFGLEAQQDLNQLLPVGTNSLETALMKTEFAITRLQVQLERRNFLEQGPTGAAVDPGTDLSMDILKIRECVVRLHRVLEADLMARKSCDPAWGSEMPTLRNPFGINLMETQKMDGYHMLVVYLLKRLAIKGYMRYRGACYEEIESPPMICHGKPRRFKTRAWRRVMDIKDFVMDSAPKETSFDMWKSMLTGNNVEKASQYLLHCRDPEFADLKPDRHQHSYTNGLQCTQTQEFWSYDDPMFPKDNIVSCKYHTDVFQDVDSIGSSRHNDSEGDPIGPLDWYDIPTPHFQKILTYQFELRFDEANAKAIIRWIYVLLGRFMFEVNERDSWQVIPFIVGRAGTGKSKILDTIRDFFNDEDIATLANNSQKGFGLETIQDKLGWRCYEVKRDFSLDQAQLQSMITGEEVSIQRKNKEALQVVWKAPGLLAGNEVANWSDNSGSIGRRIILIKFARKVDEDKSDPHLGTKIKSERAALMHKCARAYHEAVEKFGNRDIWGKRSSKNSQTILPPFYHELRQMLKADTHAIAGFLAQEDIIKILPPAHRTFGMPMRIFEAECKKWAAEKGYGNIKWGKDKQETVFEDNDIEEVTLTKEYIKSRFEDGKITYDGHTQNDRVKWLYGVTLKRVWDEFSKDA